MENIVVASRNRLPSNRKSITHKFTIKAALEETFQKSDGSHDIRLVDVDGYITAGFYPDGSLGEVFITIGKQGGVFKIYDCFFTAVSIGLQCGIPLEVFYNKFRYSNFEPFGFTNNPNIPKAKSIVDYVFNWLESRFPNGVCEEFIHIEGLTKDEPV